MRHVFVETNWLVDYAAPAHHQIPDAVELLAWAAKGEIRLYLPSICISEARRPLLEKYQPRSTADRVRAFLRWARRENVISNQEADATRRVLDMMESKIKSELDALDTLFSSRKKTPGLEVLALSQEMLELCTELSYLKLALQPFDQAILASVLVKAKQIAAAGNGPCAFCELDSNLQPWGKEAPKEKLTQLYDEAKVWVYGDFLLANPRMPEKWPEHEAGDADI
jgi:predicted nucleic acid-binding protein